MKRKLLIIGASGHGKVVADIATRMNRWGQIAFLDDNKGLSSSMGLEVIGTSNDIDKYVNEYDLFVGIGNNATRSKVFEKINKLGASIQTLIHPSAVIGTDVLIGEGTAVMAGAIINCSTKIGAGCIINTGATVDHDNHIEDFVHISPGAHTAGNVKIGKESWLGIGSIVSNNIYISDRCVFGAGSVVIRDIVESGTYIGVPVRRI